MQNIAFYINSPTISVSDSFSAILGQMSSLRTLVIATTGFGYFLRQPNRHLMLRKGWVYAEEFHEPTRTTLLHMVRYVHRQATEVLGGRGIRIDVAVRRILDIQH